jgi:DNA polymerase III subunit delta'
MVPFANLVGQSQAIELLTQAVAKRRIAPAYLFAGAAGVGKSLAAQGFLELLLTKANGRDRVTLPPTGVTDLLVRQIAQRNHPDLLWVEPTYLHQGKRLSPAEAQAAGVKRKTPPQVRLEQIREITQFLSRPPLVAARSLVVIEQAETMAEPAANALLKTLEEPGQATLILLAPSADALLPTLVSRCQRIPFRGLNPEAMAQVLEAVGYGEILAHPELLALAQGSPGAAIAHWERIQTLPADLLAAATQIPSSLRERLTLARQIAKTLDPEAQLWLVDYLEHCYWQKSLQGTDQAFPLHRLEKVKQYLLANVNPQLIWEVTLMEV